MPADVKSIDALRDWYAAFTGYGEMLSESLAQYSALMVMEHHFGREKMRRFLK